MILNDLEPPKLKVLVFFLHFSSAAHISRMNCAEITRDICGQPAYEIFSIERKVTF